MDWVLEFLIVAAWVIRLRMPAQQIGLIEAEDTHDSEAQPLISRQAEERQ